MSRQTPPGSITIKMIAVDCCKQKYFQGVSKAKGLSESITTVREYINKRIPREYHSRKYCREVPQTKVLPVNVTIKRNSRSNIIKTTAREGHIQNDDRECNNQMIVPIKRTARENDKSKFDEGASQSKRTAGSISIKVLTETTKFPNDSK